MDLCSYSTDGNQDRQCACWYALRLRFNILLISCHCVPYHALHRQVSDFGLAKIIPEQDYSQPFPVTAVMGTKG